MVSSSTLGFSPHLPVLVYGTDTISLALENFLGNLINQIGSAETKPFDNSQTDDSGFAKNRLLLINGHNQIPLSVINYVLPLETNSSAGILTCLSIDYAFRPRLRTD